MTIINGGQRIGNNLFYILEEFSVDESEKTIFNNTAEVEYIFAIVWGNNTSAIGGRIQTQGKANFFLINPNGIIFEANAKLAIAGSIIATTATSIQFQDRVELTVSEIDSESNLANSTPIKLRFKNNSGAIIVNGSGNQIKKDSPIAPIESEQLKIGLTSTSNQTLNLAGNGLNFNGGVVSTFGGQIYLSSIKSGEMNINQTESGLTLAGLDKNEYQNIDFNRQSLIYAGDNELQSSVSLTGKNISLLDGSFVLSQNRSSLVPGSLKFNATETLTLSGKVSSVRSNIRSESFQTGKGAKIIISADKAVIENGGRIRSNSFGNRNGGAIEVDVNDSIQMTNSSIIATTFANGNAGQVELSTSTLRLNAAGISSSTNGKGNGGTLNVNADLVEIIGTASTDRASIATTSFSAGDAGNLLLKGKQLRVIDGASLSSSSFGDGNAGDMTLNVTESIEVKGKGNDDYKTSNNAQSIIRSAVQTVPKRARKALGLPDVPSGNSGNLTIETSTLNIIEQGVVSVENQGTGNSGLLSIFAQNLDMRDTAKITAANTSGTNGKISLKVSNLQMDDSSRITPEIQND